MLDFLGEIGAAIIGAEGQRDTNEANAQQAAMNREWQERMSNTAHQREVKDLLKAGLNPILSGTGGKGAATGAGAQAQMGNVAGAGVSSALEYRRNAAEVANMKASNLYLKQQAYTAKAAEARDLAASDLFRQQFKTEEENTRATRATADTAEASAKGARIEGEIDSTTWGKVLRYINRANPLGNTSSAFGNMLKR